MGSRVTNTVCIDYIIERSFRNRVERFIVEAWFRLLVCSSFSHEWLLVFFVGESHFSVVFPLSSPSNMMRHRFGMFLDDGPVEAHVGFLVMLLVIFDETLFNGRPIDSIRVAVSLLDIFPIEAGHC